MRCTASTSRGSTWITSPHASPHAGRGHNLCNATCRGLIHMRRTRRRTWRKTRGEGGADYARLCGFCSCVLLFFVVRFCCGVCSCCCFVCWLFLCFGFFFFVSFSCF